MCKLQQRRTEVTMHTLGVELWVISKMAALLHTKTRPGGVKIGGLITSGSLGSTCQATNNAVIHYKLWTYPSRLGKFRVYFTFDTIRVV